MDSEQMTSFMKYVIEENNFKEILRNTTVNIYERYSYLHMSRSAIDSTLLHARKSDDETLDFIALARKAWEVGINEELYAIVTESRRPFTILRGSNGRNPLLDQNCSSSLGQQDNVKFLFDSEDLLETGLAIQNPNVKQQYLDRYLGLLKLNLNAMDLEQAIKCFGELSCHVSQLGLDELSGQVNGTRYAVLRHEEGEALIACGDVLNARIYLRKGCPPSLRSRLWRIALGLSAEESPAESCEFERLKAMCHRYDLITDELLLRDIQTVTDDPRFFVFEDELKEVILCFSRDRWVRLHCAYEVHRPIFDLNEQLQGSEGSCDEIKLEAAPPSGVQPFLGLASYFAPLGYVYRDRVSLYSVSRLLFCQLWCKLNVMSSCRDTLLTVCKTFETLLLQVHPALFLHLVSIGLQPLKVAFSWIQLGFVGLFEMDQLLHLWDRLIGYMDPSILAVAAAAVFVHRAEALMRCATESDASLVLVEGSRLRIIPLIQMFLYKDFNIPKSVT